MTLLGGSSHDLEVVIDHGDRFRPLSIGLWDPFQITSMALHVGDPNHLQVLGVHPPSIPATAFCGPSEKHRGEYLFSRRLC